MEKGRVWRVLSREETCKSPMILSPTNCTENGVFCAKGKVKVPWLRVPFAKWAHFHLMCHPRDSSSSCYFIMYIRHKMKPVTSARIKPANAHVTGNCLSRLQLQFHLLPEAPALDFRGAAPTPCSARLTEPWEQHKLQLWGLWAFPMTLNSAL